MIVVEYHPGGVTDQAPGFGRAYLADSVAGTVTRWDTSGAQISSRSLTAEETAQFDRAIAREVVDNNKATIEQRAATALSANDTYLALANPSNAQNLAQIRMLTRECTSLIRLLLGLLDTTDGTG